MGSRYLTDLADVLRAAGLTVIEVGGLESGAWVEGPEWKTRARGSGGFDGDRPWAICWHHTASAPGTSARSNVQYATFTSENEPVCNLYLHADGAWYVCAAGATNTEGKGGPWMTAYGTIPLDSGNSHFIGIEAGNSGVGETWPQVQIDSYFTGTLALQDFYAIADIATHAEWAPSRKIDPATAQAVAGPWHPDPINQSGTWSLDDVVAELHRRGATPPTPTPEPPEDDVEVVQIKVNGSNAVFLGMQVGGKFVLWMEWVNGNDKRQLERYEGYVAAGIATVELNWGDVKGVGLLGAIPDDDGLHEWTGDEFGNVLG